jgi:hypothetical protein
MHFPVLQPGSRSLCLAVTAFLLAVGCGDGTLAGTEAPEMPTAPAAQTNWATYQDPVTGFSVRYPSEYVVLPEPRPLPDSTPGLVQRVRFQAKQVASGQLADVEPPRFRVEVFDAPAGSLRAWLDANNRLAHGAVVQAVTAPQTREAARVTTPLLLAPNVFYYYLTARYVFYVVPLGPFTDDMLASFRVP